MAGLRAVPEPVTVRVPGKVNLHLGVDGLRDDGYHELTSVFLALSVADDVTASLAASDGVTCTVRGEGAGILPTNSDNLAVKAALLLAEATGIEPRAHLEVVKGVPVAGGMAGGSADAAGALVACNTLWRTGLERDELAELAAELGSDVPFALLGGVALGTGRGEQLSPVLARGTYHLVLALAEGGLSTPKVFAAWDSLDEPVTRRKGQVSRPDGPAGVLAALRAADAYALGKVLCNDLTEAALTLRPELAGTLGAQVGQIGTVLSGSGPTVAFLFASSADAAAGAAHLMASKVCRAVRQATGPVPGARIQDR